MSTSELWFATSPGGRAGNARAVLFCLPHAGGGATAFVGWAQALAPDVAALPVKLPGRESRLSEPSGIDPPVIASAIASALGARGMPTYAFYGHSLGGWLAFEVARELRALGMPPPARLYIGASRSPDLGLHPKLRGLATAPDGEVARRLVRLGGMTQEVFDHQELAELVLEVIRADFGWLERYTCRPQPPLAVPIVAFAAVGDQVASEADIAGWAGHTSAGLTVHRVVGDHLFAQQLRAELTDFIKADLLSGASSAHRQRRADHAWKGVAQIDPMP